MKKIIIAILTLALIITAFASCVRTEDPTTTEPTTEIVTEETTAEEETTGEEPATEESTTEEPVTEEVTTEESTTEEPVTEEVTTEESTTEEKTTKAPETTTKKQETTTKKEETTTKKPVETTTKKPETTTKAPETTTQKKEESTTKKQETTTKKEETTTKKDTEEKTTEKVYVEPWNDPNYDDSDLSIMSVYGCSPERAGLIYNKNGYRTTYEALAEGEYYWQYDENGYDELKQKPYSPGNEPVVDIDHCSRCGKETKAYDGKHYGCYYGYCDSWISDINCPECGVFIKAHTCHTCAK